MSNVFDPHVGALRLGVIASIDKINIGQIEVLLKTNSVKNQKVIVKAPQLLSLNNGVFIGSKPTIGTPVLIGTADSTNEYFFISYYNENISQLPKLNDDEVLIQSNKNNKITLNKKSINIGSSIFNLNVNTEKNILSNYFKEIYNFTESSRKINGNIKRENISNIKQNLNISKIENDTYDDSYNIISIDPTINENYIKFGKNKNPPFVENREIIYEFNNSSNIDDDYSEYLKYSDDYNSSNKKYSYQNRRLSKADTLSLSLTYPNYLIETIKGTAVDVFGNILDINRFPLPIGDGELTLNGDKSSDLAKSFLKIKESQRKSIAYHFELNARKDFTQKIVSSGASVRQNSFDDNSENKTNLLNFLDFNSKFPYNDYGRLRSRFFIDIDKEGQFKINVPASSEKGNIPALVRYENYSYISDDDNKNINKLIASPNNLDILHDSFAAPKYDLDEGRYLVEDGPGSINIKDNDSVWSLQDRNYENIHIKHGMPYHDILATCYAHQKSNFLDYVDDITLNKNLYEDLPLLKNVVSDTIKISGDNPNAGGRSGSINFDGSIEMSIGANTVDRQSLLLDTAGGIVANIGRDNKNMSSAISMNGDVFIQIGGIGVYGDSRFKNNNGQIGAVLDLRVLIMV